MERTYPNEDTSQTSRNLLSFSEDESINSQDSQKNSQEFDSFSSIGFPVKSEQSPEENEKDDKIRYYLNINENEKTELKNKNKFKKDNQKIKLENKNKSEESPHPKFKTWKETTKGPGKNLTGRKRKIPISEDDNPKIHDKYHPDNVKSFIQVKVMSSIPQFANEIVSDPDLGLEEIPVFRKMDHGFTKIINKKTLGDNKKKTIGDLLKVDISLKYKHFSRDSNKKEYEKVENNEIIKAIFSQKYKDYFNEFFYRNKRVIDLSKFGLQKTIHLSNKVKFYEDIFKGKKKYDEKYRIVVEEVIKSKFLI